MVQYLFDLDTLPELGKQLALFGHNRPALISFHERDHGDGTGDLRAEIDRRLALAGLPVGGRIQLLCLPRILGYAFNPLSVYFCHAPEGQLAAIIYEVNNTFGERHSYLIPVAGGDATPIRQACDKAFYVSPFMDMALRYDFTVIPPNERVGVKIAVYDAGGLLLDTIFSGQRREMTDATLTWSLFAFPLMTLKVVAGIHWEALRLWLKGVRLTSKPPPPAPLTIAGSGVANETSASR
jgi:DUF1365 family protein